MNKEEKKIAAKNVKIQIRMTKSDKEKIDQIAEKYYMTTSQLLRYAALNFKGY